MSASPIVVALDYSSADAASALVETLDPSLCRLKVGKELFTTAGPDLVKRFVDLGFDIFLDLKFHDIPNTVAKAVAAAANMGVWMLNVHASGGLQMMAAARESLTSFASKPPLLTAVTVLTSTSGAELSSLGISKSLPEQVDYLAGLAKQAGLDGVVCSAQEAGSIKQVCGDSFVTVTPGIRPEGSEIGDQHRIMTPSKAMAAGSDYLVIGRPVTQAQNPKQVLTDILDGLTHRV